MASASELNEAEFYGKSGPFMWDSVSIVPGPI